jgi:hypothetical protein
VFFHSCFPFGFEVGSSIIDFRDAYVFEHWPKLNNWLLDGYQQPTNGVHEVGCLNALQSEKPLRATGDVNDCLFVVADDQGL